MLDARRGKRRRTCSTAPSTAASSAKIPCSDWQDLSDRVMATHPGWPSLLLYATKKDVVSCLDMFVVDAFIRFVLIVKGWKI
eukprot:3585416-Amphidinium_carterae.2